MSEPADWKTAIPASVVSVISLFMTTLFRHCSWMPSDHGPVSPGTAKCMPAGPNQLLVSWGFRRREGPVMFGSFPKARQAAARGLLMVTESTIWPVVTPPILTVDAALGTGPNCARPPSMRMFRSWELSEPKYEYGSGPGLRRVPSMSVTNGWPSARLAIAGLIRARVLSRG